MDCFRDDNDYDTQRIDSLFTRAERLGNVLIMWLSGKLYELLPFDKHGCRDSIHCANVLWAGESCYTFQSYLGLAAHAENVSGTEACRNQKLLRDR